MAARAGLNEGLDRIREGHIGRITERPRVQCFLIVVVATVQRENAHSSEQE